MAGGAQVVGSGTVIIKVDDKVFQEAMRSLPEKSARQIDLTMKTIQAALAKNKLQMDIAVKKGDIDKVNELSDRFLLLQQRLDNVKAKAVDMSESLGRAAMKPADALDRTATSATKVGTATERASGRGAQALYQIGAAVDDLQYGIRGVLNNIPQIAIALGNPAMAGSLAILVTGAYQLYTHWDSLMRLFGEGRTLTESEAMKELASQTERTANEQERLNRAKQQKSTVEEQEGAQSKYERESAHKIREAISEAGYTRVTEGIFNSGLAGVERPNAEVEKVEKRIQDRMEKIDNIDKNVVVNREGLLAVEREKLEADKKELERLKYGSTKAFLADVENNRGGRREQLAAYAQAHPERFGHANLTPEELERRIRAEMQQSGAGYNEAKATVVQAERRRTGLLFAGTLATTSPAHMEEADIEKAKEKGEKYDKQLQAKHDREKKAAGRVVAKQNARQRRIKSILDRFKTTVKRRVETQRKANLRKFAAEEKKRKAAVKRQAGVYATSTAKGDIGAAILNKSKNVSNLIKQQFNKMGVIATDEMLAEVEKQTREKIAKAVNAKRLANPKLTQAQAEEQVRQDMGKKRLEAFNKIAEKTEEVRDRRIALRRKQEDLADHLRTKGGSFVGLTDFAKQVQHGALNAGDFQRKTLRLQEDMVTAQRELLQAVQQQQQAELNYARAAPG